VKILGHKVLYKERRFHAAFPSIVRFNDDRLVLAFRRARDGIWLIPEEKRKNLDLLNRMDHIDSRSHIMLMELDADGKQQADELDVLPVDPEAGDQDPSLLVLPDDKLFLASFSWYPLPADAAQHIPGRVPPGEDYPGCRFLFWGSHTSLRQRQPSAWLASHRYIQPDGGFGHPIDPQGEKHIAGSVRGQAVFHQGQVKLALYGESKREAVLFVSDDEGASWHFSASIASDPEGQIAFQEPALCHDGRGGLVCFMRGAS